MKPNAEPAFKEIPAERRGKTKTASIRRHFIDLRLNSLLNFIWNAFHLF